MLRALIVDDIEMIRVSLAMKLEEIGESVWVAGSASNGKEALEWLELHYADICITDVRMPMIDGLELIQLLTERFPWMTFIVVSNYSDFQYVQKSIKLEAVDFILKPVDIEALKAAVGKAEAKIRRSRNEQASELLLQHMVNEKAVFHRWIEHVLSNRFVSMPVLIMDTLEMFEKWTGERFYLLEALSEVWLGWIVKEIRNRLQYDISIQPGAVYDIGEKSLSYPETRRHYRLRAVKNLEEYGNSLLAAEKKRKQDGSNSLSEQIQAFIKSHYMEKLTLDHISEHVAYSKSYITNTFKEETDMTVWEYVNYVRITEAQKLILDSTLRINEIANRIGVPNAVHFNRIFKEYYGISPLEYRKRMSSIDR